ncbi:DNA-formamidopyrimidine glycosylase family protein [Alteriqipengyuania lutimaris]|uniref:DNA-formamidopyrimidine glycosylase n=1 Tax=Alteriqipengyuania lutimaris TaxID=1538146 RepID=A0A395LTA5_9SPHN|nr:DNA-formamidopyrimidine glycosylase family protein [Alteriqipengyuania lutimaris]MBB3033061.1 formamidopyrimidine-DNA glycosylase [Alteriqipengyuania lutimaris]RDS78644.1 DNA-formamidopyrimidine glycosylase [Alteriqipengyuania lutimaris]
MPEAPEAEANRLRIERKCLNRTMEAAEPGEDTEYIELPGDNERARLVGHQFTQTHRHGKLIFAGSKTGPWIGVHLGMTGSLRPFDEEDGAPDYTKFLIRFEGDRRLAFRCPRKLGWVRVVDNPEEEIERIGFGPDALEISRDAFVEAIGSSRGAIKSALMAQQKLAGIGNLWSDEILYRVGIGPERKGTDLSEEKLAQMYDEMRDILKAVMDTEATYRKLPDDWLIRHREEGAQCPRCDGEIVRTKVSGRSAYHCDRHQE